MAALYLQTQGQQPLHSRRFLLVNIFCRVWETLFMASQISQRMHTFLPFSIFLLLLKKEKNHLHMCTHVCMSVCVHANPSLTNSSLFFPPFSRPAALEG